jgi:bifunctional DNA-binding transcriptional regulator/antitoxin component of YhaV-PrlF toxin-antitoxin module
MSSYLPCPQCGSTDPKKVNFTWWGGMLGPRLFQLVKCNACGFSYNGKTGKSNTKAIVLYSLVVVVIVGAIAFLVAFSTTLLPYLLKSRRVEGSPPPATSPTILTSTEGRFQITLPAGWREVHNLNAKASLQAANGSDEAYIFVIARSRKDIKFSLDKFTELTRREFLQLLQSPQVTAPTKVVVNGQEARRYEARGTMNGINAGYVNTTVQTPNSYYQIVAYALGSSFDQSKGMLADMAQTFRETASASSSK